MKITAIGDSIVNGYPMGRNTSFTGLLRSEYGYTISNRGVNGDTTYGMLERFQTDVLSGRPDVLLIHAGTNDFIYGEDLEAVWFNLQLMIQMAEGIRVIVLTPVPVQPVMAQRMWVPADYMKVQENLKQYAEKIRTLQGIEVIDTQKAYEEFAGDRPVREVYFDGIHPQTEGHAFLAEYIDGRLKEIL